jgi:hypothetical protein
MRKMLSVAVVIALTAAAGVPAAVAAGGEKYKTKTEECLERAKAKRFGVHFIRRDRWIRKCIRGDV